MNKNILLTYGTRPEYIKILPLMVELKKRKIKYKTLFTGQHNDIGMFDYDYCISISDMGFNRLDLIVKSIMDMIPYFNVDNNFTHLIVQGDTTSALAIAISGFHNNIKVIHLEAGLRTYDIDNPYPEEINRRLISQIANIHLCPTKISQLNLIKENENILSFVVGNTVIDNLVKYKGKCEYGNKILITMHRRENHKLLSEWFTEINKLAKTHPEFQFILPIHPNPQVQKHKHLLGDVNVINPLEYEEMLELLTKVRLVITDSGGLQEECSYFNKKCLVCRKVTERPEAIGQSSFLVKSPEQLENVFNENINDYIINYDCPFGDGKSAEKIVKIFNKFL